MRARISATAAAAADVSVRALMMHGDALAPITAVGVCVCAYDIACSAYYFGQHQHQQHRKHVSDLFNNAPIQRARARQRLIPER